MKAKDELRERFKNKKRFNELRKDVKSRRKKYYFKTVAVVSSSNMKHYGSTLFVCLEM